jgi:hypothetical protein
VARAVAPYGAFGLAYFCLVSLPQLVSGGAWLGRYGFNGSFSLASGLALIGLVPVAGFGTVAAERLMRRVLPEALARHPIGSVSEVRATLMRHWRGQLAWAALAGAGAAAAIDAIAPGLGHHWLLARGLHASPWLLYACSAGFFFFAIGTFSSTLLFSLSSPGLALAGAWSGTLVLLGLSGALSVLRLTTSSGAAASGFIAGTAIFAAVAVWAGERAFSKVDLTCYRSL